MTHNTALSRRGFCTIVALATFLGIAPHGCRKSSSTPDKEVRIGALLALTGDEAKYGTWAKEAIDIAVDEINAEGGIKGRMLRVVYEDSGSTNNGAVNGFRKLISVDKVPVVIGATRSASTLACAPIANEHQVVLITPTSGSPKIADAGDFVFRTRESGELQARVLARYVLQEMKLSKLAILYPQEANALGYKIAFAAEVSSLGGQIMYTEAFPEDKADLRAEVTKLLAAAPQAVYIPGTAVHIARAVRQTREIGGEMKFLSSVGAENPELIELAGEAAEGLVYSGMAFDPDSEENVVGRFVKRYRDKYDKAPNAWAANAHDAAWLVARALQGGAKDGASVRDALYATTDYAGAGGVITFDGRGEAIKSVAIKTVHDGTFIFVAVKQ